MASLANYEVVGNILDDALRNSIRTSIKNRLMKVAEEEIEPIIDKVMEELKTSVESYRDMEFYGTSVRVLVEKKGFDNAGSGRR